MRAGANDYLTKPIKIDEFQRRFNNALQMVELNNVIAQQKLAVIQAYKLIGIGQMAQTLIGEMSAPVLNMLEQIDVLREAIEQDDKPAMKRVRDSLSGSTLHIGKTIRGIGLLAPDNEGNGIDQIAVVALVSVIQQMTDYFSAHALSKDVDILFGHVDRSLFFKGRSKEVLQAISNLIEHAIDSAAGQRERWVNVETMADRGQIVVAVTNSGIVLSDVTRSQLFGPIIPEHPSVEAGNGLGLSIARDIVLRNGGSLTLDPNSKKTRLLLSLPLVAEHRAEKKVA